jgi:Tfp pilus assembly protein PilF
MRPVPAGLRVGSRSRQGSGVAKSVMTAVALGAVVAAGAYGTVRISRALFATRRAAVRPSATATTAARPASAAAPRDAANGVDARKAIADTLGIALPKQQGEPAPAPSQVLRPAGPLRGTRPTDTTVGRVARSGPGELPAPVGRVPRSGPGELPATAVAPASTVPASPAVDHFALAVRYQSLGDFEQALRHYLAVLDADAFNVEARNNLGLLYHDRGMVNESVEQLRKAVSINPQYLKARSNLAVVLMDAGRVAEARAELREALRLDPRNVDLLVNMALIEKSDHQPDAAIETLLRAIGYQPSHALAHYNLALLYEEKGELGRAYDQYTAYLQLAGPEQGALLSDVRHRLDAIRGQVDPARR